jgi:tetratricopeptide (TPR) repeat protein
MKKSARRPQPRQQPTVPEPEAAGGAPPAFDRRSMDKIMADIGRLVSEQEFESINEANALVQGLMSRGGLPSFEPRTPLEEAQELVYQAFEAQGQQRVRLARQALEVCPDCTDAYVLLAEETARTDREALDLYRQGVEAGERALGPVFFEENEGHFWGLVETRPYMRARFGLAQVLWTLGDEQSAIEYAQEMLRLNPGDNQGVRYVLMLWLLETERDEDMAALLEKFPDDGTADGLFPQALFAFRQQGDSPGSRALLQLALQANVHVPDYLLGRKQSPPLNSAYVVLGSEDEAANHVLAASHLWRQTPGALEWLARRVGA